MMPQILLITYITTEKNIYGENETNIESEEQIAQQDFRIEHRCQPNKCQNLLIRKQIRNIVRDHYNFSIMYKVLKVKVQEDWREKEEIMTTTVTSTIITTQPVDDDAISRYSSINTIYMLLLSVVCVLILNLYN
jgi:hypothetical protein